MKKLVLDPVINWSGSVDASKNPIVVSSCRKEDVIRQFREVFSSHSFDIGKCKKYEFSIKCPDNVSLSLPSRRIPLHLQNKVDGLSECQVAEFMKRFKENSRDFERDSIKKIKEGDKVMVRILPKEKSIFIARYNGPFTVKKVKGKNDAVIVEN